MTMTDVELGPPAPADHELPGQALDGADDADLGHPLNGDVPAEHSTEYTYKPAEPAVLVNQQILRGEISTGRAAEEANAARARISGFVGRGISRINPTLFGDKRIVEAYDWRLSGKTPQPFLLSKDSD